jgi:hypothetical protein
MMMMMMMMKDEIDERNLRTKTDKIVVELNITHRGDERITSTQPKLFQKKEIYQILKQNSF